MLGLVVVLLPACGKLLGQSQDAGADAAAITAATASDTPETPSASAAPTVVTPVAEVKCAPPTFKLVQKGHASICLKPCSASADCTAKQTCKELTKEQDPTGKYGSMFCFPQTAASASASATVPVPAVGKCPAGEVFAGSAMDPGCYLPCKADTDCSKGSCQELPYIIDGSKGCTASAHAPGTAPIMQPKGKGAPSSAPSTKPPTGPGGLVPGGPPHL